MAVNPYSFKDQYKPEWQFLQQQLAGTYTRGTRWDPLPPAPKFDLPVVRPYSAPAYRTPAAQVIDVPATPLYPAERTYTARSSQVNHSSSTSWWFEEIFPFVDEWFEQIVTTRSAAVAFGAGMVLGAIRSASLTDALGGGIAAVVIAGMGALALYVAIKVLLLALIALAIVSAAVLVINAVNWSLPFIREAVTLAIETAAPVVQFVVSDLLPRLSTIAAQVV
jgi:hypothetical protein